MTSINEWSDFWFYKIGANVIPADTQKKTTWVQWGQYQDEPISEEQFKAWKDSDVFKKGIAIISGKLHRGENAGKYLIFIDCDNQKAIDEFVAAVKAPDLQTVATKWIVEQHNDAPNKAHIYVISPFAFPKKSSDSPDPETFKKVQSGELPAIEIKGEGKHGIAYCSPSKHKNGHRYSIIGTKAMQPLNDEQARTVMQGMDDVCTKYGIKYLEAGTLAERQPATELFEKSFKVYEGSNRHEALLRAADSLIKRNAKIADEQSIKGLVIAWNRDHCVPPLNDDEVEKQWKCAKKFMAKHVVQEDPIGVVDVAEVKRYIGNDDIDKVGVIEGRVHSIDQIRQVVTHFEWKCKGCGEIFQEKREKCNKQPKTHPPLKELEQILNSETMEDQRFIELILFTTDNHEEALDEDFKLWLNLTGENVHKEIVLGQDYRVTGRVAVTKNQGKSPVKEKEIFQLYMEVDVIEPIDNKEEKVVITDEERAAFRLEAVTNPKIMDKLVDAFAPHIFGQDIVKESILHQIVGARYSGNVNRGDIHQLVIGDPSEGKTELALFAARIAKGEFASGESVSKVGIGAGLVKDDNIGRWVIQGGIAVIGNKRLKCLDEIDKMPREYLNEMLTIMDKGFYKLDKVKHALFETLGAWLCTGNPKGGKYDTRKNLWQNIDFPIPVLTRFDLIWILKKSYDVENTKKKIAKINNLYTGVKNSATSEEWLTKYLLVAKECTSVTIEPIVFTMLEEFYHRLEVKGDGQDTIPITERQYHGMMRFAIARAKLHLRNVVTAEDAKRAIEVMTAMMFMVGVDVSSGAMDMGSMVGKAETQKSKEKELHGVLRSLMVGKNDGDSVSEEAIVRKMMEHSCWADGDAARNFIRTQQMEGKLWSPRSGYWCIT